MARWEEKERAEEGSDFDFSGDGRRTPKQIKQLQKDNFQAQLRAREKAEYENIMPDSPVTDLAGKIWAYPATLAGAAAGSLNVLAGQIAGHKDARITVGNNALQFEGGWLGEPTSAFTLGNSVIYGPEGHPDTPSGRRYDGRETPVTLGDHEKGHTYQFGNPLFPARWVIGKARHLLAGLPEPIEDEADDFAEEAYRRRRK